MPVEITMDPVCTPPPSLESPPTASGEVVDDAEEAPSVHCNPVHVFISPVVAPVAEDGSAAATPLPPAYAYNGLLYLHQRHEWPLMGRQQREHDEPKKKREKWLNEMRGWLIVVAVLVASVTYQAGLNPPGGNWQDSNSDHGRVAGDPVLRSKFPTRYAVFFYFNATAFLTSLAIIVLLMDESFYHSESKVVALKFIVVLDMVMLMGAYLAGSTRTVIMSMYTFVFGVVVLAFLYVVYTKQFLFKLWGLIAGVLWARGDGAQAPRPEHIVVEAGAHRPPGGV
ncbi:unnamed protein product [Urochloa humidicola]